MIVGTPTKLNLIPSGVMPVVYINQGDAGYDKEFLIYNGDTPYNVPSDVSATIRGTKADNYGVTEAATVTTGSNLVTVTITEQMVAAAGKNIYELVFVDTNDLRVASINMVWAVKQDALGDSVISDSDLDYATTVMNTLQSVHAFKNQLDANTANIAENADGLEAETAARIAADNAESAARQAADATLQSNINAEASARTSQDANLQAQINQIIAPSGSAPSAAEVQNARIGANGITYSTLGDAIRGQVSDLKFDLNYLLENIIDFSTINTVNTGGVNFVVNKAEKTITATGTAVRNLIIRIKEGITGYSKIILKGGATGGSTTTYTLAVYDTSAGSRIGYDNGSATGTEITLDPTKTYFVAVVVLNGVTVNNVVFTPCAYVGGIVLDLQEQLKKADLKYRHFAGIAFICECGEHVFIDTVNFRLYDKIKQTYTASKSDTTKLAGGYSSVNYIHFDGSTFTRSTAFSSDVIAYVYQKMVVPLIDGIIPNYRKIQDGYIRNGSEYYINFDRTPIDALGVYFEPDVKISKRGYIYKSAQAVSYNINDISIAFTLSQNLETIGNKKILMIGDSFVARGYIQNWLHSLESTLQFIGTKTTQYYDYKSEGVSGSRLYYFTDPNTSPFYFNGALDFAQYLSTNNLDEPDYVVINSAINHTAYNNATYGTYLSNLLALVNMVKAYNPSIKIYVTYGANYAIEPGSTYNYPNLRYIEVRKCCNSVYDVDGVTIIPVDSALIDELDYNQQDIDYLGKNVSVLSDCVHPSETVGFRKIANMIYNYLGV